MCVPVHVFVQRSIEKKVEKQRESQIKREGTLLQTKVVSATTLRGLAFMHDQTLAGILRCVPRRAKGSAKPAENLPRVVVGSTSP